MHSSFVGCPLRADMSKGSNVGFFSIPFPVSSHMLSHFNHDLITENSQSAPPIHFTLLTCTTTSHTLADILL